MSTREERERRRAERLEAEKREAAAERRRLLLGYVVAGALSLAVVVGIVIVVAGGDSGATPDAGDFPEASHIEPLSGKTHGYEPDGREGTPPPPIAQGDLEIAAREAGCELDLDLDDEGNTHITDESDIPDYETVPPTSGDHNPEQLADGAYSEYPEPWYTVHSMEHGRVEIQYSPDLPEKDQLALKGVFDEAPAAVLFFPNPEMPYDVAVTAWTQLMTCDTFEGAATLDAIRDFRDTYLGRGPEPVAIQLAG